MSISKQKVLLSFPVDLQWDQVNGKEGGKELYTEREEVIIWSRVSEKLGEAKCIREREAKRERERGWMSE